MTQITEDDMTDAVSAQADLIARMIDEIARMIDESDKDGLLPEGKDSGR